MYGSAYLYYTTEEAVTLEIPMVWCTLFSFQGAYISYCLARVGAGSQLQGAGLKTSASCNNVIAYGQRLVFRQSPL